MIYSQFLSLKNWCCICCICCIVENTKKRLFFMPGRIARLGTKSRTPENPSNLPQNRFKCLRRAFVPPRQKFALYGALK